MGSAGPSGTGLIPPGVGPGQQQQIDPPSDPPSGDPGGNPPTDPPEPVQNPASGQSSNVDDLPPVPNSDRDGDHGNDDDDDDEYIDPNAFREDILNEVQRRFDKAISKIVRRQGSTPPGSPGNDGGEGGGGNNNPPAPGPAGRQVDTMSIRSYARGVLNDEMESAGRTEKQAVRKVLDSVLEHVDWTNVDDEEEYVEGLVKNLAQTSQVLIKTGSDRKVAQLRASGMLPQRVEQPGSTQSPTHSVSTGMAQGAAVAGKRWPGGRRRLNG